MASMVVISTTAIPDHVGGALSRWLIEPCPGLFVGTVSARVRDELWAAVSASVGEGAPRARRPRHLGLLRLTGLPARARGPGDPR
ncbi:type I-E CRISPR-associated endoribonuclease Cas2e, partial [Sphaerisporangium sp. NPDC049002]|uniref:type I-E CRISPR-associated endoribonuclease Cas2e n=1 Tax=Sphaerisporangium sp. NPDC049002 TaxID=3155392 RepID=UPI0033EFC17F